MSGSNPGLDDALINRIAAGEVVERPASVVKELVENAVDAGAGRIEVRLRSAGREQIRVVDDGCGMDRDDAILALERHATSKLSSSKDLDSIATLGFRGEALSSIAAVCRFVLQTAVRDGAGTEIEVEAGRIRAVRDVGLPRGTTIQVARLFYNVPARRKFLRSDATELSHILRWLTRYAMAYPALAMRLTQGERRLLDAPAAADRRERIERIYGSEFARGLLPVGASMPIARLSGFTGRPVDALPNRDSQHFIVNGRAVQDRVLSHALGAAYGNTMVRGRYAASVLFLETESEEVDVNVHPQKTEIRFRHSGQIHDFVRDAVAAALGHPRAVPSLGELRPTAVPGPEGIRDSTLCYLDRVEPGGTAYRAGVDLPHRGTLVAEPVPRSAAPALDLLPGSTGPDDRYAVPMVPLAQFRESYILANDAQGLVLVDQHAAHERVIFERYLEEAEQNRVEVQRLLFPVTIELPPHHFVLLEAELGEFRRLGFLVEPFGGATVRLDGVPALARRLDPATLFRELLGEAERARAATSEVGALRHRLITTAACHAAIKVNHPLTSDAMRGLLDDLARTVNPTTCPHGRPVLFRLTLDEIERAFRRR